MPPLNIAIYYYRGMAKFHKAIGRVEYHTEVVINLIFNGKSMCNNSFIIYLIVVNHK